MGFDLVMPFVVVESVGGPYRDDAFCAGYMMGLLDAALDHGEPSFTSDLLLTALLPQADLIAMRHGYQMIATEQDYVWSSAVFCKDSDG